ncbi:MAG: glutathione S-transferase [Alphaproteobacteria bacterium]|nr:glutathione S-transferase [Alphaproteobacteria bacterium]
MITVHHLNNSRSQRVLWLLEELEVPYDIKFYQRDPLTRLAPPELKAVHPLGKSPVVTDGSATIAESGAIIEYLVKTYGKGRFWPKEGAPDYFAHAHWMHFAEGSAMTPLLLALYAGFLGEGAAPLRPRIESEITNHLAYMETSLGGKPYFLGNEPMACDFQLAFVLEAADAGGRLKPYSNLTGYLARIHARPAYKRGVERGGPYQLMAR